MSLLEANGSGDTFLARENTVEAKIPTTAAMDSSVP